MSHMSQLYAIRDRDEAVAYLRHPVLFARLLEITTAVAEQVRLARHRAVDGIVHRRDQAGVVLTLFSDVARSLSESPTDANAVLADLAEEVLIAAAAQGYQRC